MDIRFYNYWNSTKELEWNFGWGKSKVYSYDWSFRIGTHQLALWKNSNPIF